MRLSGFRRLCAHLLLSVAARPPTCWSRDLVRKTAGLAAVQQGAAWVEEFGAIRPIVCEGPLWGSTLAALTQQAGPARGSQPEPRRPGKAKFSQWERASERNQSSDRMQARGIPRSRIGVPNYPLAAKRKASKETRSSGLVKTLSQLQAHADPSLLSRLADSKLAFEGTGPQQARSSPMNRKHNVAFRGMEQEPIRSFSTTEKTPFSAECRDSAFQQDWLGRLAQRVGRVMISKYPDTARVAKFAQDDAQLPGQSPSLVEQWTMPLDGACASLDLLDRLVQEDFPGDEGASGTASSRFAPRNPSRSLERDQPTRSIVRSDEPSQRVDKGNNRHRETDDGSYESGPRITPPVAAQVGPSLLAPESDVNEAGGDGVGDAKSSTRIIPPNITPLLPPLLPPRRAGVQPLPVAAATARQGADEETMMATDDLDVLAAKIKQILDEQARRHGIDV